MKKAEGKFLKASARASSMKYVPSGKA